MREKMKKLSSLLATIMICVMASPLVAFAADAEKYVPKMYASIWSLVPPVVAIALALITKEVYSSLFVGILVGGMFYSGFSFEGSKFTLDSKAPDLAGYEDFLNGEVRYNALARFNPEKAKVLFAKNEEEAKARYAYLQKLVTLYGSEE